MFDQALGDDRRREFVGVVDALATAASTVEIGYVRLTSTRDVALCLKCANADIPRRRGERVESTP
ncbi:MAG TPA: hypothetical protein VFE60_11690 [Roseiarcus sp.]|jgi:hypothetical protein|nr:hypothetical protein [Roseiarcus sp.]